MIYDLAIIGGGPAGYTAAELAGKKGLKTILFEKHSLGGVCLNEGCIPTKTLLYSAKVYDLTKDASKYGISCDTLSYDLPKIMARKNKVIRKLVAGIRAKMNDAGVEMIIGQAKIKSADNDLLEIECNEQIYTAKKIILCTGSEAIIPLIPGIEKTAFWTSKEALDNQELPESLIVIGGGVIGIEFASFLNSFGSKVKVIEMMDEILFGMDKEVSAMLRNELTKKGIEFYLNTKVISLNNNQVEIEKDGEKLILQTDKILLSVGRKPVISGLKVNDFMQTENPNIYACGDITGISLLAHTAIRQAEVAVNHILGKNEKMSYQAIPGVVYTNPEMASVGKTEELLQKQTISYKVKKLPMAYSGRFVAENEQANGICKILEGESGEILGVHILGNYASEIIVIAGMAIEKGMKTEELKKIIFPHPTVSEIIKETL